MDGSIFNIQLNGRFHNLCQTCPWNSTSNIGFSKSIRFPIIYVNPRLHHYRNRITNCWNCGKSRKPFHANSNEKRKCTNLFLDSYSLSFEYIFSCVFGVCALSCYWLIYEYKTVINFLLAGHKFWNGFAFITKWNETKSVVILFSFFPKKETKNYSVLVQILGKKLDMKMVQKGKWVRNDNNNNKKKSQHMKWMLIWNWAKANFL